MMKTVQHSGNTLDKAWQKSLLIWKAGFVFLALCLGTAFGLHLLNAQIETTTQFPPEWHDYLTYGLFGVAVVDILLLIPIRRIILKNSGRAAEGQAAQQVAANRYTAASMVSTALLSSIGIYGLVVFVLSKDIIALVIFLVLAVSGMLVFRPNRQALMDLAQGMSRT